MSETSVFELKAQKYKKKYLQLKYQLQHGGAKFNTIMDIIELFRKLYHSVEILKVLIGTTIIQPQIKSIEELKKIIQTIRDSPAMKTEYKQYYTKEGGFLSKNNDPINIEQIKSLNKSEILFILRQDTTKSIKTIAENQQTAIKQFNSYISIIDSLLLTHVDIKDDLNEIKGKCKTLVEVANAVEKKEESNKSFVSLPNLSGLDILRDKTNNILHLISSYKIYNIDEYIKLINASIKLIEDDLQKEIKGLFDQLTPQQQIQLFPQITGPHAKTFLEKLLDLFK
jgi:hypothetical protein